MNIAINIKVILYCHYSFDYYPTDRVICFSRSKDCIIVEFIKEKKNECETHDN